MFQFDLGWTSDDGCNVFALGWLSRLVLTVETDTIIPKGGLDDAMIKVRRLRNKRKQRNIKNLFMLVTMFVIAQEETYGQRHETDETD